MRRVTVLLAGGASSRMGTVKWKLPVGGVPVLGRMVRELAGFGEELAIVLPWDADAAMRADAANMAAEAVRPAGGRDGDGNAGGGEDGGDAGGSALPKVRILQDEEPYAGPLAGLETA